MRTRCLGAFLIVLIATILLLAIACEEEEGDKCCECICFKLSFCDPEENYTIYGENMDCRNDCKAKCDFYHCDLKDFEVCPAQ